MESKADHEWKETNGRVCGIFVVVLYDMELGIPLLILYEIYVKCMEQGTINHLCLTIGLGVKSCGKMKMTPY